jgi:hypothetical protein
VTMVMRTVPGITLGECSEAERPSDFQIDDQFEFGRLLNRQLIGLGALENAYHVPMRCSK